MPTTTPTILDQINAEKTKVSERLARLDADRAKIAADLAKQPEKALVIVRYSSDHQPLDEWVYNAASIDNSKVVWAREMDEAENLELIHHYKDRTVWLVQPDSKPAKVSLYPSSAQQPINVNR